MKGYKDLQCLYLAYVRGRNNAWSSDMTECICHLIGHKFPQFQVMLDHFGKQKIDNYLFSFLYFKVIYQRSRNNKPEDFYLPRYIFNNYACALF